MLKGTYMVTGKERVTVDYVNKPISISGVQVRSRDIILGGDSGVIVLPANRAEEILKQAKHIEEIEQKIIAEVKKGSSLKAAREKLGYPLIISVPYRLWKDRKDGLLDRNFNLVTKEEI